MQYDILLTQNPGNGFTARPLLWPEVVALGDNEGEALARVQEALAAFLANSRIVKIELPTPSPIDDPWLRFVGMWSDIPEEQWESFQAAIAAHRLEIDQQQSLLPDDSP